MKMNQPAALFGSIALVACLALTSGCHKKADDKTGPADGSATPSPRAATDVAPSAASAPETIQRPDQARTAGPVSNKARTGEPLYERLMEKTKGQGRLRPGETLRLGGIPPATEQEMADPKLQHLNPATRRAIIAHRKLQQRVPELTRTRAQGKPAPPGNP